MEKNTKEKMVKAQKKSVELTPTYLSSFFEELHMFLKSGISTWEALAIISENTKNPAVKNLYFKLYEDVVDGKKFSEAMEASSNFPPYAVGLAKVGEQTGRMEETTLALQKYYEQKDKLARSIKDAVMYPMCMAGMVLVVIIVLIMQVMPVFEQVFAQLGLQMNSFAQSMLNIGNILNKYAFVILAIVAVLLLAFLIFRATNFGKKRMVIFYDVFPLTKKLSAAQAANRFAFSMSLMLASGIETLMAFDFAQSITESEIAKKKVAIIKEKLEEGTSLNDALMSGGIFSVEYQGMIVAGMRTGETDEMLMTIAKRYEEEAEDRIHKLLSIIEPTLVAILCVLVGMVMLSVMLPLTGILAGL